METKFFLLFDARLNQVFVLSSFQSCSFIIFYSLVETQTEHVASNILGVDDVLYYFKMASCTETVRE